MAKGLHLVKEIPGKDLLEMAKDEKFQKFMERYYSKHWAIKNGLIQDMTIKEAREFLEQ